jgi:Ni2+-binding GTPase involved in maturation of urease and hydrogenase
LLLINKADLIEEWSIEQRELDALAQKNWHVIQTSAKTGAGVEEAFLTLAQKMMET